MHDTTTPSPQAASTGSARIALVLRLIIAGILGQTLFFKFTAAPESVHIFETLGVEPWGRIGSGLVELAAIVLILSRYAAYGALLAAGTMVGAIGAHLTLLGVEVAGDGGLLFILALLVLASALGVLWIRRLELPFMSS